MALKRWSLETHEPVPVGAVLFDTTLPLGKFHSYHVMMVSAESISLPHGGVALPVSDMTGGERHGKLVRWPDTNAVHELHPECFIGYFPELTADQTREALEELRALRDSPNATENEFYTLATHGVWVESPNNPGNYSTGIRCSCASLIEYCYAQTQSEVDLVREDRVPRLSKEDLWILAGPGTPMTNENRGEFSVLLRALGLKGDGPWPVLLPAYQMHAFSRKLKDLPDYHPHPEHHPYTEK